MLASAKQLCVLDTECYRNFWLCKIRRIDTRAIRSFITRPDQPLDVIGLRETLDRCTLITFNGIKYDAPMIGLALTGASCETLKRCSDFIIQGRMNPWDAERQFNFTTPMFDQIDMIEVAPGMVSLKVYMGRLNCPTLQDLPIEHDAVLTDEQCALIDQYNDNDLDGTEALYRKFLPQIELRRAMSAQYGVDMRSKSDAQIAEAVFKTTLDNPSKAPIRPRAFKIKFPNYLRHAGPIVQGVINLVRETDFVIEPSGYVKMPEGLTKAAIAIGEGRYRMGIGGLHSSEQSVSHYADGETLLIDRDVASFYPAIIINTGLYPRHLGKQFLALYRRIRDERIEHKHAGRKVQADALKIVLNGSFGKFGNPYSILYSPELLMQVTITGQLTLLMLIEMIESQTRVVSANTDGIVIKCHPDYYDLLSATIKRWEELTGYETEETRYLSLHSRDVNSYMARKVSGGFKLKGAYSEPEPVASSWPSPHMQVCVQAVCDYIEHGVPIELTIRACDDIRQFIEVRNVTGGATWRDEYLGRAVRWYYSTDGDPILYRKANKTGHHNKVAGSDGCRPLMRMDGSMPVDLDISAYVRDAEQIVKDIGL